MASREQLSLVKGTTAQINAGTPALGASEAAVCGCVKVAFPPATASTKA